MKANGEQPTMLRIGERVFYYTYTAPQKDDRRIYWSTVTYWEDGREQEKANFHLSLQKRDLATLFFQLIEMEITDHCRHA